jgi:MFS superfamily sulfate permease-like transporter
MSSDSTPAGGLAGLRHWRHDAVAGLQVALLWTPFSLGVALASGAPAIAGLISAIVAGLLTPFLGGSHVSVSGPAAALAPVLLWGMLVLGGGDLAAGYPLVLVAVALTGVLQLAASSLRAGQYASMLPATVVEAMLAAIGIMIIVRQIPSLVGVASVPTPSVIQALAFLPQQLAQAQPLVAALGAASLALMFVLRRKVEGFWRWLPAAIVVAAFGVLAGAVLDLDASLRIRMPDNVVQGIAWPAFAEFLARPDLWLTMALVVVTFTLIDGVESVASVKAIDKIDPWRRKSDANRTLRAMGACNVASGLLGGLTVIPNAVPSRANIEAGARTLWANLYSGLALLVFVLVLPALLARIPLAAIAAILIYIGWRLCEPALFSRMRAIGLDRFIVFTGTVAAILATDLLVGMLIGVAIEMALLVYLLMPSFRVVLTGRMPAGAAAALLWQNFSGLFRGPVIKHRSESRDGRSVHLLTLGSLVGFNLLRLEKALAAIAPGDDIELRFTESARIIDHTAVEFLQHVEEEAAAHGRRFTVDGLENFYAFSAHPLAARMQEARIVQARVERDARAQLLARVAERLGLAFSAGTAATINRHGFVYLRRGDQREESNVASGRLSPPAGPAAQAASGPAPGRPEANRRADGLRVKLFDYSHTSPPDYHVAHRHTLVMIELPDYGPPWPELVLTPGHYLERYLVHLSELPLPQVLQPSSGYRAYGVTADAISFWWQPPLLRALADQGPLYLEIRPGAALLFRPQRGLEDEAGIDGLLQVAHALAAIARSDLRSPP